jgi:dTDP-glucose 4,6-dehydratase
MKETICVTGGLGFIGSNFILNALQEGYYILNIDIGTYAANPMTQNILKMNNFYKYKQINICNQDLVYDALKYYRPTKVIHFAAESHVDNSILDSSKFITTNLLGTHSLLTASLKYWEYIKNLSDFLFLHVSTDEVFGSLGRKGAFTEKSNYAPNSPYSATKAGSDHLVRSWNITYGLPTIISHCSNNYGPLQNIEKFIPKIITNLLSGNEIPIYGNGKYYRDWMYVGDHIGALNLIMNSAVSGQTYCIGADTDISNIELATKIALEMENALCCPGKFIEKLKFVEDRAGHDFRYSVDSSKISADLGWVPLVDFETGLNNTVDWYMKNRNWWVAEK